MEELEDEDPTATPADIRVDLDSEARPEVSPHSRFVLFRLFPRVTVAGSCRVSIDRVTCSWGLVSVSSRARVRAPSACAQACVCARLHVCVCA